MQNVEHVLGKYIISDKPMTEEQWAKERATVIDEKAVEEPRFGDGREERHLAVAAPMLPKASESTQKPSNTKGKRTNGT